MNEMINIARLKYVAEWLQDGEEYGVYIRDSVGEDLYHVMLYHYLDFGGLEDCIKLRISDLLSQKRIQYIIMPQEMEFFSSIVNDTFSDLIK